MPIKKRLQKHQDLNHTTSVLPTVTVPPHIGGPLLHRFACKHQCHRCPPPKRREGEPGPGQDPNGCTCT